MWCSTRICSSSTPFLNDTYDVPNTPSTLAFFLFADDTSIYFESGNLEQHQKVVNYELKHAKKWLDANKLALNVDKTMYVIFDSPQNVSLKILQ